MASEIVEGFRLSPQQRHLWLLQRSTRNPVYQILGEVEVTGRLYTSVLNAALNTISRRHEILRTTFQPLPGMSMPVQVISDQVTVALEEHDLAGRKANAQEQIIRDLWQEWQHRPWNFEQGPLCRVALITLSAEHHRLLLNLPALCADAESLKILVREIREAYIAELTGEEVAGEPMQFADLSEWQNERLEDAQAETGRDHWRKHDWSTLLLQKLPFEKLSVATDDFVPRVFSLLLPASRFDNLARQYETSVETFLLACWQVLIWRLTGQPELVIGQITDARNYEALQDVVGRLARWLPVHCGLTNEMSFGEVLRQAHEGGGEARRWQDYFVPDDIWGWGDDFPICYEYMREQRTKEDRAPRFQLRRLYACSDRFRLKLFCRELVGGGQELELHYDASRFAETDVERLGEQYVTVVASAVALGEQVAVSRLEVVGECERARLVEEFNRTEVDYGPAQCVHELIEEQARRTPETAALVFEQERLSYAELNARANQLAHYLRGCGVGPESLVGILMERSAELVVGLLGVLKAGAAYVPLDPGYPSERLRGMLEDAAISLVLTDESQRAQESWLVDEQKAQVVYLNNDWSTIADESNDNPISDANAGNLAYALFTSGSTGIPKSVGIEHRQLFNYVKTIIDKLSLPAGAGFAMVSTFAADLGDRRIFTKQCTGGTLHVISRDRAADAVALSDYLTRHQIDCLKIVPSHLDALMSCAQPADLLPRRCLVLGGETAHWERVARIRSLAPSCRVINHYGPTETTVGVLTRNVVEQTIPSHSATLPLGRPLGNIQAYVLDEYLNLAPTGAPGEIYLGGAGVSRGYLFRPELTAEKFVPDRFSRDPGKRLYKTGDLGRYLPGGEIEFLGRIDHQVKLHGFRIELGEIEAALAAHDAIAESLVLMREDNGEQRLVAYLVTRERDHANLTSELREFLRERVPEYMVPSFFVTLDQMPLTANGKIDRARLPVPDQAQTDNRKPFVAPRTPLEEMLAGIWSERLNVARIGVEDNFFDLGGHSLLAMQLISQLHELR